MTIAISPSIHLSLTDSSVLQDRPHFGYQSYVTDTNITATNTASGYFEESLANPLTTERWKPNVLPVNILVDAGSQVDVNYIGLAAHSFGTNECTVQISYSETGSGYTLIDEMLPGDNKPIMFCFDLITARYWKIRIIGLLNEPSLGVVYVGKLLTMPNGIYGGHTPITLGRKNRVIRNKTEGGQYAGVSVISEGVSNSVSFNNLDAQWYRDNFDPFVVAARAAPFFFSWRNHEFRKEVGFCWTTDDIRPQNMGVRNLMSVEFNMEGFSDE